MRGRKSPRLNHQQQLRASGPATSRGEETRTAILRGARKVFERDGYLKARVADIATAAKVSHGSFYSYFTSKEDVFKAVANAAIDDVMERMTSSPDPDDTEPIERIRRANQRYIDAYRDNAVIIGLLEQAVLINDEIRETRLAAKNTFVARAVRGIAHMQEAGLADPHLNAQLAAEALALMVDRTCYMWFVLGQDYDEQEMPETLTRLWARSTGLQLADPGDHRIAPAMNSGLHVSHRGAGLLIELDRPDTRNALTMPMLRDLRTAVHDAEADPAVVGIVITGCGRGFCSGYDTTALAELADAAEPRSGIPALPGDPPGIFSYLPCCSKPVIAAVNGAAAGGGFVLAMMADLRFVSPEAVFVPGFAPLGLIGEHGTAWLLPRLVGTGATLELLWSGDRIDATRAHALGLVNRLVPGAAGGETVATAALDYVQHLADTVAPRSLRDTKRLVYRGWAMAMRDALAEADTAQWYAFDRGDAAEGVTARAERRPPRFTRVGDSADTFPGAPSV